MRTLLIIIAVVLGAAAVGLVLFLVFRPKPELSAFEALSAPRITRLGPQRMVEVTVRGKPEESLPAAFGALYQLYFSLPEAPRGGPPPAARLRCAVPENADPDNPFPDGVLVATVGLPLPDSVKTLPAGQSGGNALKPAVAVWEYNETAEILHRGPYDAEVPTIKRLLAFIKERGYAITGIHEEEYVFGPGAPGAAPDKYLTVIRYPVRKAK